MERSRIASWLTSGVVGVSALAMVGACSSEAAPSGTEETRVRVFANGSFEVGTAGAAPPAWTVTTNLNPTPNGVTLQLPQTESGLNLTAGGVPLTVTLNSPAGPGVQPDALMGLAGTLRWPKYGNQCALVNRDGLNENVNTLQQTMTVGAGDVDPTDGRVHIRLVVAPVLENPAHTANQQPYFYVQVTNLTQANAVLYQNFNFSNQAGVPWQTANTNGTTYLYTDWQLVDVSPGSPAINQGDMIELQVIAAGCSLGGHEGQVYVDGVGTTIPGINVSATGPAQANAGSNITYTGTYRNGASAAETGVTISIALPPNTTFQSFSPPPGATCTTPLVGATGTITCTFVGAVAAGASGTFTLTVNVNAGTTGSIVLGTYSIRSLQETGLIGNSVTTIIGCTADAQCPTGDWCNESASACTPKESNGVLVPTDTSHANPTLNGTCTAAAGALVCLSAVCDSSDNKCGYLNGDGACTAATGAVVCRSAVCDPDLKCGYAVGDGPCTAGTASIVCRSGACSGNGTCEPAGGCDVDADCSGGKWCDEATHTCTAKLANGTALPTDASHANPTLNGTCTAAAGLLVCVSGVCDATNSECGYATGDGPCTVLTGPVVCQTGACSTNGKCEPVGGCDVDADCTASNWCAEATHTCTPKLANGGPVPTDPPHVNPTLNGVCTTPAGALTCVSGVCDPKDNDCGFANGDGPCTAIDGAVVCRSGACSLGGTCEPAGGCEVDADCTALQYCNTPSATCVMKVANGQPIPTVAGHVPTIAGTCTLTTGADVCASGVCDATDNDCGYANGEGPCTAVTAPLLCRSTACSTDGKCEPLGGCEVDADCTTGNWCDETTHACTPQLANGTPIPTDAAHVSPTLNGTCTAAAGKLVCTSAVCDAKDNECGFANGDGPCTTADGPTECRSGTCSATGSVCIPASGCAVDSDCGAALYCNTPTSECVAKVANGQPVPTVAGHTPILNGTCTVVAGTAACASGVCDVADGKCGYANGDGPCTATDGSTDCRSGACSTNLTCEPAGGCNVDADCATGNWCNESMHACVNQLPNGAAIPTDTAHANPAVAGLCTAAAAKLVCTSGVCDVKDNECGYADGDGPCTATDGATDCRSTICATSGPSSGLCVACLESSQCSGSTPVCDGTDGTCVQCVTSSGCPTDAPVCNPTSRMCTTSCTGDASCPTSEWCDIPSGTVGMCTPKIPNGKPLPTTPSSVATCSSSVGKRVCVSGVCDRADNTCGAAPDAGADAGSDASTGCTSDDQCGGSDYCSHGDCVPKLALGAVCSRNPECVSADCAGVCSEVVSSGAGVFCAVRSPGSAGGNPDWSVLGVMLGLVGVGAGRRRARRVPPHA